MRIKKKTSVLLFATAVAAVIGIAAVSFAAWNGGTTLTANASTGTATLEGFTNSAELTFGYKLVPWDQSEGSYDDKTCAKVITGTLTYNAIGDYTISVELKSNTAANAKFYVSIDENQTATFTKDGDAVPDGWTEFSGSSAAAVEVLSGTAGQTAETTKYVHIAMASDNSATDMDDKQFSFEIVYHSETLGNN